MFRLQVTGYRAQGTGHGLPSCSLCPISYYLSSIDSSSLGQPPSAHIPVVINREANALFCYGPVLPADWLDARALQVFVDGKEVLDLSQVVGRQVGVVGDVVKEWIVVQDGKDLIICLAL